MKINETIFRFFLLFSLISLLLISPIEAEGESRIGPGQGNTISAITVPTGARIYLNDELLEKESNSLISNVPDGIHIIRFTLSGYYDCEDWIDVSSQGTTYVSCTLEKKENSVRIISNPKGADIFINGVFRGKTDQSLVLNAGQRYLVNLSLPGYYPYSTNFFLKEKSGYNEIEAIYHDFVVLPEFSSIYVISQPSDAEIFIDGNFSGKSNIAIQKITPGSHNIKLRKFGFDDYQTSIVVTQEKRSEVNVTLRPQDGILNVDSTPVKGSVYLDGSYVGDTPYIAKTPQGLHKLEIKSPAFASAMQEIDLIFEGQTLVFELIPLAQSEIALSEKKIAENSKYNPDGARRQLDQSRQQLDRNEYIAALESAKRSGDLAGDVDQDRIPNWLDMQPSVPNNYLYGLPLGIFLLIAGLFFIDWRRCRATAKMNIVIEGTSKRNGTSALVTIRISPPYKNAFCVIELDGKRIPEIIDSDGEHRIMLGKLSPGFHQIFAELDVKKIRYGKTITTDTLDFEIA